MSYHKILKEVRRNLMNLDIKREVHPYEEPAIDIIPLLDETIYI